MNCLGRTRNWPHHLSSSCSICPGPTSFFLKSGIKFHKKINTSPSKAPRGRYCSLWKPQTESNNILAYKESRKYLCLDLVSILLVDLFLTGSWYQDVTLLKQQVIMIWIRIGEAHYCPVFLKHCGLQILIFAWQIKIVCNYMNTKCTIQQDLILLYILQINRIDKRRNASWL